MRNATPSKRSVFFLYQYQLDPEVAKRKLSKTDEDSEKHLTEVEPGWWTKEQMHPLLACKRGPTRTITLQL